MDAAENIRQSIARVTELRARQAASLPLATAVRDVKQFQSRRFMGSYADLMRDPTVRPATTFFLDELYSPGDFSARDAQFVRIAGTLQTVFPRPIIHTALTLALLHALTEEMDHAMGQAWLAQDAALHEAARYVRAWRSVGRAEARRQQLAWVMELGQDLTRFTRTPGLRLLLRTMRRPAQAAGMGALQHFLEMGFDTFGALAKKRGAVEGFLDTVRERETRLMDLLFDAPLVTCETQLASTLGQAP
ncbi:MAG: FFLEELY motif protein [Giesbergeria sp.]